VEVLGTHFNINTYGGEPSKITLLEGSVVVKPAADNNSLKLAPGEQAVFPHDKTGQMELRQADIDQVMAWKNGLFRFRSEDVASIARQLGVWYNVAIVYEGASGKKVTGYISRSASLEEVLKMLEIATGIHSEYKDGTIVLR
jgi:ferric-dicitrate binding protein FerR (iron transport regulator)